MTSENGGFSAASILRPKALRPGDLVAVMALSGGLEQSEASLFARGVEAIEQMGFAVARCPRRGGRRCRDADSA